MTPSVKPIIFPVYYFFSINTSFCTIIFQLKSEYNTFRHILMRLSISFYVKTTFCIIWDAILALIKAEYIFHIWTTPCFCFLQYKWGPTFFSFIFCTGCRKLYFLFDIIFCSSWSTFIFTFFLHEMLFYAG